MRSSIFLLVCLTLGLLVASTQAAPTSPEGNAKAHQQLDEILKRPMFQAWQLRQQGRLVESDPAFSHDVGSWVRKPFRAIGDFLEWLFSSRRTSSRSASAGPSFSFLPTFLKVIAWAALAAGLVFLAVIVIKSTKPAAIGITANILTRQQVQDALEAGDALALGTSQWMDEAKRLADEQNFRAVYRALYLALLSGLHARGKIEHNRNRTNWTYVQHYLGPENELATFSELTNLFDLVWYGRRDAGGNDLEQLRGKVALLTNGGAV